MAASFRSPPWCLRWAGPWPAMWMGFTVLLALVAIVVGLAGISGAGACLSDLARKRPTGVWWATSSPGCCACPLLGAGLLMMLAALALFWPWPWCFHLQDPGAGPLAAGGGGARGRAGDGRADAGAVRGLVHRRPLALWDGERVMHSLSITWHITRSTRLPPSARSWAACCCRPSLPSMLFGLITSASFTVGGLFAAVVGHGRGLWRRHGLWLCATAWVAASIRWPS